MFDTKNAEHRWVCSRWAQGEGDEHTNKVSRKGVSLAFAAHFPHGYSTYRQTPAWPRVLKKRLISNGPCVSVGLYTSQTGRKMSKDAYGKGGICSIRSLLEWGSGADFSAHLPHGNVALLISEEVDVDVGADLGWPLQVHVVLPETLQRVERPRLRRFREKIC